MAISFIGQATGTTTATLPAHQTGDLIVAFAFRDGSTTAPNLPGGWTNIRNDGANACAGRIAYKTAASSSEASGTWTNATSLIILVYRGTRTLTPGANASGAASSTTVNYPALTLQSARSYVVGFAGHASVNTSLETPPAGMTNRATVVDATDEAAAHDTNGKVSSWSSTNVSVAGTSAGWRSYVLEVQEAPIEITSALSASGAATYDLQADPKPAGYRITESGDRRITEAGDARVTEKFASLSSDWISSGSTFFLAEKLTYMISGWSASGAATFDAEKYKSLASDFVASSSISLEADAAGELESHFVATANASFDARRVINLAAPMASVGSTFFAFGSRSELETDWVASSAFTAKASKIHPVVFQAVAQASFHAEAEVIHDIATSFSATGTFTAKIGKVYELKSGQADVRITESGNRRITESGDRRILSGSGGESTATFDAQLIITTSNVDVKFGGVWVDEAETFINDNGTWRRVKIYANQNGVWKLTR